ncbi:hypothetical protein VPH35_065665 [Triticum aestivum]
MILQLFSFMCCFSALLSSMICFSLIHFVAYMDAIYYSADICYYIILFANLKRSLKEKRFSYAPESGVRYDGVYSLRTVGGRLVFSAVGRAAYRVPPRRLLPPPIWDLTARSPPGTPTTLESEQTPLARGHRSRVQDGDGAKEDSRTPIDCIVAAVPMEWRGSNHSEMRNQYNNRT